jgi:hypothetical protein
MKISIRVLATAVLLAGLAAADTKGTVTIDTSALVTSGSGPFTLDLQFIEGDGGSSGTNTITLSNFSFGGGSVTPTASSIAGGVTVASNPFSVTMVDSSFFQDVQFTFTPGSVLSFQFDSTSKVDAVAPDTFTLAILDSTLTEIPTNNPNGFNSLLEVDLPTMGSGTQATTSSAASGNGLAATATVVTSCDVRGNSTASVADVQRMIDEALGTAAPSNDLNSDGAVNVADIQIVMNAALGQGCPVS